MGKDKEKKVMFSEEIDSSIDGFALGITFVLVAFFEVYFKIFGNRMVEIVLAIGLLLFGIFGTLTEIGRISTDNIKGGDDLVFWALCQVLGCDSLNHTQLSEQGGFKLTKMFV